MNFKLSLCSTLLLSLCKPIFAADAGLVIDSIKAADNIPGRGKLTILLDRVGYPTLSAADPKSPFYQDWLGIKKQLENHGSPNGDEGKDRTTIQLNFSQWLENKPLPVDKNPAFTAYRDRIAELTGKYSKEYRLAHPWDAAAFLAGSLKEFELQLFCWTLPVYIEDKGANFLPKFLADRATSMCSGWLKPFDYPAVAYHLCEVDEDGISPECADAEKNVYFTPEEKTRIANRIRTSWMESWSGAVFDPGGYLSSFALPMQNYCSDMGLDLDPVKGKAKEELMQFRTSSFLLGSTLPYFDTTLPPAHIENKTDWIGVMLGCSERFAEIAAYSTQAIEKTLAHPRFDRNPWLSSMLYDLAKDYPTELSDENSLIDELNQKLTTDIYAYKNGYSANKLQPGIEFNREVIQEILDKKARGAEILLLMLAETEANKNSPWRLEFKSKTEDEQKGYLSVLVRNVTRECPTFGADTITDSNCVMGWLSRFNPKQTPRIELKRFGKATGFVRYGIR